MTRRQYASTVLQLALRVTGAAAIGTAAYGLWFNLVAVGLSVAISGDPTAWLRPDSDAPFIVPAFFVMSSICVAAETAVLVCGVILVRGRLTCARFLAGLWVFEIVYQMVISALWFHPTLGRSVASATGISGGGLYVQFSYYLPYWSPAVLIGAKWAADRSAVTASSAQTVELPADEQARA